MSEMAAHAADRAAAVGHRPLVQRRPRRTAIREALWGLGFISPWLVGTLGLTLVPMVLSLYYSFTKYDVFSSPKWVGLTNYLHVTARPLFWQSLLTTICYTAMLVPVAVTMSLACALLLNARIRGRAVFRGIFFFPSLVPSVAAAYLWLWMFNPEFGLLNSLLARIGIHGPNWLGSDNTALVSIVIIALWGAMGGTMMITFLAALQSTPRELYEAAEIDGAGKARQFFSITVPMISPTIFFNLIIATIGSFTVFDIVYVTTGGGPQYSTYTYFMYIFNTGFHSFDFGEASAMTWILTIILFGLTALQFRLQRRWVYYGTEV
jgi:multiple sugar transport system permease protein